MRVIVAQAALPPAALAELKQWLGVTTGGDDAQLVALLRAALDVCADFTGVLPLASTCEEIVPATMDNHVLATRPVTGLEAVYAVAADGGRTVLAAGACDWLIGADGSGRLRSAPMAAGGCGWWRGWGRRGWRCRSWPGWRRGGTRCPTRSGTG